MAMRMAHPAAEWAAWAAWTSKESLPGASRLSFVEPAARHRNRKAPQDLRGFFCVFDSRARASASIAALLHAREFEFIAVYSLPHGFASPRIAVHLFLRITEKFELEHPHGQSCADEG
jgi:hypothetical protein